MEIRLEFNASCRVAHGLEDDAREARACLTGKHVLFIGDSLTRYQYLNLVNFLENGHRADHAPHLVEEFQWNDWVTFYTESGRERLNGHEICDCRREGYLEGFCIENRLYWRPEPNLASQ